MAPLDGCCCLQCVQTGTIGIVEMFGKFSRVVPPGMSILVCPFENIAGRVSMRVRQLDVPCETKTKDNVFITVVISVQYEAIPERVYDAYYKLSSPELQIQSYVYDVVRSTLPKSTLEEAYASKEHIAEAVLHTLDEQMKEYGFQIQKALVTDLSPELRVKNSFNDINASRRMREAQQEKAEAEKILQVKAAEADAESKYLSGVGVARQRAAIVEGLRDSIADFSSQIEGTTPKDIMDLLLLTQYFDMLKDVGQHGAGKTLFLPHGPDSVAELQDKLHNGIMKSMIPGSGSMFR